MESLLFKSLKQLKSRFVGHYMEFFLLVLANAYKNMLADVAVKE